MKKNLFWFFAIFGLFLLFSGCCDRKPFPGWSIKENGTIIEIAYGSGTDCPQYAALHRESSYFRMNYGANSEWGTSVILLPSFWEGGILHQGAPITATLNTDGADIIITFTAAISSLKVDGQLRISPPTQNSISALVSISVMGNIELDTNRPGEAFKPVMLSSMHISSDIWDAQSAYVDSQSFQVPQSGWIIDPPTTGKVFGLKGGTSTWKTNAPTIEVSFEQDMTIAGWVTTSTNPNDDNVGFWAASDVVIPSWQYQVSAKP